MADDTQPIPNQNESAPTPDPSESEKSSRQDKAPETPVKKRRRWFLPKLGRFSFYKIDSYLKLTVSITVRTLIVVGLVLIIIYLYRELNDKRYHIQEFEVPEDLVSVGYNGKVVACTIQDEVDSIIYGAGLTWSPKVLQCDG